MFEGLPVQESICMSILLWGMGLHWVKFCKCGVMRFKCLKAYHAVFMSEFGLTFSCIV